MSCFEYWMVTINITGLIAVVISLRVYFGQLEALNNGLKQGREQILMVEKSSMASNLLTVAKFLQNEEFQRAKNTLADQDSLLLSQEPSLWPETYRRAARTICSCYDILGLMIKNEVVSTKPILENWGRSILHFHNVLERFVEQEQNKIGPDYWNDFTWLAEKVRDHSWSKVPT